MNKIYKLVWSKARNCYVAVSELAINRTKAPGRNGIARTVVAGVLACVLSCGAVMPVSAAEPGKEIGTNSVANGEYSISTGKNSIAIGKGAVATGDNMTRESIESALANNKQIQDTIDASRAVYQQQLKDYNTANTAFQNANEVYLKVKGQDEQNAIWQAEIDNTLQPNVTSTTNTYNTAKSEYDTLYNNFQARLSEIKNINFNNYIVNGEIDRDNVAVQLKSNTEIGTSFDLPVSFYRNYIDNYIANEGDKDFYASKASVFGNYTYNGIHFLGEHLTDPYTYIAQYGNDNIATAKIINAFCDVDNILTNLQPFKYGVVGSNNGITFSNSRNLPCRSQSILFGSKYGVVSNFFELSLDDNSYQNSLTDLNNTYQTNLDNLINISNYLYSKNIISESEKNQLITKLSNEALAELNMGKNYLAMAHEQYLYLNSTNETDKLSHLSNKVNYKILGSQYAQSTEFYRSVDSEGNLYDKAIGTGFNGFTGVYSPVDDKIYPYDNSLFHIDYDSSTILIGGYLSKYFYNHITAVQDSTISSFEALRDQFDLQIADKRDAMETALIDKTSAETALSNKQAQIANNQPTASERAQAETAAAKAAELEQQRLKLEADEVALNAAKEQLENLVELKDIGDSAIAIGNNTLTTGKNAIGQGTDTIVTGEEAVGIGNKNIITAKQAVGFGSENSVSGEESLAVGHNNGVTGTQSLAVGTGNIIKGNHSGAIGDPNIVNGDNSYAVGNNSKIAEGTSDVFVFGNNVNATANDVIALGSGSDASQEHTVSVGSSSQKRRIVNVANGVADSDVATVGQVKALSTPVHGVGVNNIPDTSFNYNGEGAMGVDSIAIGDAKAAGSASVAIGAGALATGSNSIAFGTNATATGDGMTREQVNSILSNNKVIRDTLDNARSGYTASKAAYDRQKEIWEGQNEAVARVNAANEKVAGYQAEIDNTLQPNADAANSAYNTAKGEYDALYNDLQNRLSNIKNIDFSLYANTETGIVDRDEIASKLKNDTEAGTSFDMPQSFYRNYVDNYIKAEGDLRQNEILYNKLSAKRLLSKPNPQVYYVSNGDISAPSNLLSLIGCNVDNDMVFYRGFLIRDIVGANLSGIDYSAKHEGTSSPQFQYGLPTFSFESYSSNKILNDDEFNTRIAGHKQQFEKYKENWQLIESKFLNERFDSLYGNLSVLGDTSELFPLMKQSFHEIFQQMQEQDLGIYNATVAGLNAAHEQYLYEKYRDEGNDSEALKHLGLKEKYAADYDTYSNGVIFFKSSISSDYGYNEIEHPEYYQFLCNNLYNKFDAWAKENITDVKDATKVALQQVSDGLDQQLNDKKAALDSATAAKNSADTALRNKQNQLNSAKPSAQDIADAKAAEASAQDLQQKKDKLDADLEALNQAKANLENLESIAEAGDSPMAIGNNAVVTGKNALGLGRDSLVTGEDSVGIGRNTVVSGKNAVGIGSDNSISKDNAIAIGTNNGITGMNSIAIGNNNVISGNNSVAIGNGLNVAEDNVVDFGTRKGTGLKAATLSKTSTDAVTGSQLFATNQNIAGFASDIRKNKDNISNLNTSVTAALESVSASSQLVDTLNNAKADASLNNLTAAGQRVISTAAANAVQEYMAANGLNVNNGNNVNTNSTLNTSLRTVPSARQVVDPINMSLMSVNPVPADTNFVVYDDTTADTITLEGVNGTKVTNVANGTVASGSTDAVTGGQLYDIAQQVNAKADTTYVNNEISSVRTVLDSKADTTYVDNQLSLKADKSSVYTKTETDGLLVKKADVSYVNDKLAKKADITYVDDGLAQKADKDTVYTKTEADNLFVNQNMMKDALGKKADGDASNIDADAWAEKLGTGNVAEGNTGLVNGGTVYEAIKGLGGTDIMTADDTFIHVGKQAKYDGIRVVDVSNSKGEGRVMTGVITNPADKTSAANVGYVEAIGQQVAESLHGSISQVNDRVNKVGANAAAMASLMPPSFDGDEKWALSAAMGNYKSASAGAVGVFYRPQDNITMNLRGSFGSEENMVGGGVIVALQRGNTPGVSKAQLVRVVNSQAQEIQNMKQTYETKIANQENKLANQANEIAELKAMVQQLAAKQKE